MHRNITIPASRIPRIGLTGSLSLSFDGDTPFDAVLTAAVLDGHIIDLDWLCGLGVEDQIENACWEAFRLHPVNFELDDFPTVDDSAEGWRYVLIVDAGEGSVTVRCLRRRRDWEPAYELGPLCFYLAMVKASDDADKIRAWVEEHGDAFDNIRRAAAGGIRNDAAAALMEIAFPFASAFASGAFAKG